MTTWCTFIVFESKVMRMTFERIIPNFIDLFIIFRNLLSRANQLSRKAVYLAEEMRVAIAMGDVKEVGRWDEEVECKGWIAGGCKGQTAHGDGCRWSLCCFGYSIQLLKDYFQNCMIILTCKIFSWSDES